MGIQYNPLAMGLLSWNDKDKTVDIALSDGIACQIGQENFIRAINKTGTKITNGSVVYINGAQGNRPTIALASSNLYTLSTRVIGMVTADINNNSEGYVTILGLVRDLNTSALNEGDVVYLSATPGAVTTIKPISPTSCIKIGTVIKSHVTDGWIGVNVSRDKSEFGDVDNGNYSYFESDGTLVFKGNATVYDDLPPIVLANARVGTTPPTWAVVAGNFRAWQYAVDDYQEGDTEVTHGYKEGSTLELHLHWLNGSKDSTDRTVKWEMEYWWANIPQNGIYDSMISHTGTLSVEATIPANTTVGSHIITSLGQLTAPPIKIGAYLHLLIKRIIATGTAPSANPFALAVGVHYVKDTVGSKTATSK